MTLREDVRLAGEKLDSALAEWETKHKDHVEKLTTWIEAEQAKTQSAPLWRAVSVARQEESAIALKVVLAAIELRAYERASKRSAKENQRLVGILRGRPG